MGDVIKFSPKSLVEFEESALAKMAEISGAMCRVPDSIRHAVEVNDNAHLKKLDKVIFLLTALEAGIGMLEELAPNIVAQLDEGEDVRIVAENAIPEVDVIFRAQARVNVLFIRDFLVDRQITTIRIPGNRQRVLLISAN